MFCPNRVPEPAERGRPGMEATLARSFAMIDALARAMRARDPLTHQHAQRVQRYAVLLASEACVTDDRMLEALDAAALLHDIGKLGIPDSVLLKPGPLTLDEYDQVKLHPIIGADILSAVSFAGPLALIVRHHHENWDGSGYPDALRGEEIPIGARILAVVDGYDALTSERPYRPQFSHEFAVAMIQRGRATMYDPRITEAFLRIAQRLRVVCARDRSEQPAREQLRWLREASAI
jgi:HD-GYP domain-containing protein (c-di-GMP phosphodiesterase class II)